MFVLQIVLDCKHSDQPIAHEVPQNDIEQSGEVIEDRNGSPVSTVDEPDPATDHVHPSLR